MKLTRKELNTLIENFLFEQEEETESESDEKDLPEIEIAIIKKNGTNSGKSIILRKNENKIQAFVKSNGNETKLNSEKDVKTALFGSLKHAYDTMKDANSRKILTQWIESTVKGGVKSFNNQSRTFGIELENLKKKLDIE